MTTVLDTSPASIARAAECLRSGGLVAFPTETVYGLGAHALDVDAVRKVFAAKGRPPNDPLIVHVRDFEELRPLVRAGADLALAAHLAARFWPGPLTLVLPKALAVPGVVTAGLDTVAVRVPSHPVARALLHAAGLPIAAPSANLFSRTSPTRAEHVLQDLDGRIDFVIDGGPTDVGLESTVLDLSGDPPAVLRPGAVTCEMLREVLGRDPRSEARDPRSAIRDPQGAHRSPGMLETHYAPRTPLTVYEGLGALERLAADAMEAAFRGGRVGVLVPEEHALRLGGAALRVITLGPQGDAAAMAARLYAALREADASGVDVLFALGIERETGLGAALRDRLRRAAGGRIIRT